MISDNIRDSGFLFLKDWTWKTDNSDTAICVISRGLWATAAVRFGSSGGSDYMTLDVTLHGNIGNQELTVDNVSQQMSWSAQSKHIKTIERSEFSRHTTNLPDWGFAALLRGELTGYARADLMSRVWGQAVRSDTDASAALLAYATESAALGRTVAQIDPYPGWDASWDPDAQAPAIDAQAKIVAAERGCDCEGARNCGCWNVAMRQVKEQGQ